MKNLYSQLKIATLLLLLFSMSTQAATFNLDADEFKFTGDSYIDTTQAAETRAIGRITTISQGSDIIWSNGDSGNFLNFVAGGIVPLISPIAPVFNFVGTGGYVNFFLNDSDLFDITLDWLALSSLIETGDSYLETVVTSTVNGIATGVSYSANGFLDVVGGSDADLFNTDSRTNFLGTTSDISFGLSGANNENPLVNPDYEYITSADVQGAVAAIPEPAPLALMGLGLVGVGLVSGRKNRTAGSFGTMA